MYGKRLTKEKYNKLVPLPTDMCVYISVVCVDRSDMCVHVSNRYGVATISRLLRMISFFCKRAL